MSQSNVSEDCSKVLIVEQTKQFTNLQEAFAFWNNISESEWNNLSQNGKLDVLIKGMPFGASFESKEDFFSDFKQQTGFTIDRNQTTSLLYNRLAPDAAEIYKNCVIYGSGGEKSSPIILWVEESSAFSCEVSGRIKLSEIESGEYDKFDLTIEDVDGRVQQPVGGPFLAKPLANTVFSFRVRRAQRQALYISARITFKDGRVVSDTLEIPRFRNWKVVTKKEARNSMEQVVYNHGGVSGVEIYRYLFELTATPGWRVIPGSVAVQPFEIYSTAGLVGISVPTLQIGESKITANVVVQTLPNVTTSFKIRLAWHEVDYTVIPLLDDEY